MCIIEFLIRFFLHWVYIENDLPFDTPFNGFEQTLFIVIVAFKCKVLKRYLQFVPTDSFIHLKKLSSKFELKFFCVKEFQERRSKPVERGVSCS